MALPPLNPDRTAAGIIVDPKTLERVVPTSARKDGSLRKELKIRPGFTPQEDVGRFRGSRQLASEQASSRVPGSNRSRPPATSTSENPFAPSASSSNTTTKTKAQVKNEKRRASKKAGVTKNWDESDDEDDDGELGDAFKAADEARKRLDANEAEGKESAWPVEDGGKGQISEGGMGMGEGGIPDDPVPVEPKPELEFKEGEGEGTTAILSPPPPGEPRSDPIAPTAQETGPKVSSSESKSTEPEWRTATSRNTGKPKPTAKPHPIQGGRQGPIGLAHPPPIEERSTQRNRDQTSRGRGRGRGRGQGQGSRRPDSDRTPSAQPEQETKKAPEPRVRKEVKVRETGLGSLADRVRGLVISNQNQGDGKKKEKTAPVQPAASA